MYEDIIRRLEPVQGRVDAVLDTDAFNEIDDQFALAYLLAYPERVNLLAVTAAPFFNERSTSPEDGMVKSYDEIIKVARLCGRNDAKELAYLGARKYLPDGNTPDHMRVPLTSEVLFPDLDSIFDRAYGRYLGGGPGMNHDDWINLYAHENETQREANRGDGCSVCNEPHAVSGCGV